MNIEEKIFHFNVKGNTPVTVQFLLDVCKEKNIDPRHTLLIFDQEETDDSVKNNKLFSSVDVFHGLFYLKR